MAKKFALILYLAIMGALLVNYLMGLGWFHGNDKAVTAIVVAMAGLVGFWMKSRAEKKAQSSPVVVEALDAEGAVHSDPKTRRFVLQVAVIVTATVLSISLGVIYRDRQEQLGVNVVATVVMIVIVTWVLWKRFGNIGEVESDDGVTLTLSRLGQSTRVPWAQVESVEVSRPYSFWQVVVTFRLLGESKPKVVRFLPQGWRKMTPAAAEKLQLALNERRLAH